MGESWPRSWVQTRCSEVCTHNRGQDSPYRLTKLSLRKQPSFFALGPSSVSHSNFMVYRVALHLLNRWRWSEYLNLGLSVRNKKRLYCTNGSIIIMVSYVWGWYCCRVGIGTKGVGGVPVILFKYYSESETIWFQEFIAEVKIIISCFSSWYISKYLQEKYKQEKHSISLLNQTVFFWIPLLKLDYFFCWDNIFTLDFSSGTLTNKIIIN